jgi:hypothetical protein
MILKYYQLPRNFSRPMSSASEAKLDILTQKLNFALTKDTPHIMFVEGTSEPIFSIIIKSHTSKDCWGVNFAEYFKSIFDNSETYQVHPKKFMFIYNVGLERAINTTFSAKLLKGLIKDLEERGCWIIIESDLTYQKFHTQYDIEVINKIVIPLKRPESFL